ncbi:hypothetical protein TNCV_1901051 [Trichonephila clavipes]|nr:hypothetical protein TNCV_1901051 [Trichonephila clavipes]
MDLRMKGSFPIGRDKSSDNRTSRIVFGEESEWRRESSYWLLKSEDNGSGKMAAHVGAQVGVYLPLSYPPIGTFHLKPHLPTPTKLTTPAFRHYKTASGGLRSAVQSLVKWLLVKEHVILNHGQVAKTELEIKPSPQTSNPSQREKCKRHTLKQQEKTVQSVTSGNLADHGVSGMPRLSSPFLRNMFLEVISYVDRSVRWFTLQIEVGLAIGAPTKELTYRKNAPVAVC